MSKTTYPSVQESRNTAWMYITFDHQMKPTKLGRKIRSRLLLCRNGDGASTLHVSQLCTTKMLGTTYIKLHFFGVLLMCFQTAPAQFPLWIEIGHISEKVIFNRIKELKFKGSHAAVAHEHADSSLHHEPIPLMTIGHEPTRVCTQYSWSFPTFIYRYI